ncbi:TMEM14-domain-containing protein [Nadsonia fulvescens var. elongata DSM 6958]|uniref:TMEM14-domain-containing protein n=1 Tax=Nadsonia fulvescens var. elongata DSM 6958 TaxID=857566 RepID=A0A1E3PPI7_9ASCO|nr:TMEM14-domain-containing protein [Nadsonia fulvescens var. elongata DSM 6958]
MEHPAFTLSALGAVGGIMGYVRKNSKPSLYGGLTVAAVYGTAGYLLKQNANYGIETAIAGSLLLLGAGIPRAIKTRKPVPFLLVGLGLASLGFYGKKYNEFFLA